MKKKYVSGFRIFLLLLSSVLAISLFVFSFSSKSSSVSSFLFVLDVSQSMNTMDIQSDDEKKISRLDAAKLYIHTSIEAEPAVHYGLVVFGQTAVYVLPATFDSGSFLDYVDALTTNVLPGGGTDRTVLSGLVGDYEKIVFLSDISEEVKNLDKIKNLHGKKYLVGIGTENGGIVRYANGNILKSKGQVVYSVLDPLRAETLAQKLDARLFLLDDAQDITSMVDKIVGDLTVFSFWEFNFLLFVLIVCILFLL